MADVFVETIRLAFAEEEIRHSVRGDLDIIRATKREPYVDIEWSIRNGVIIGIRSFAR